MNLLNFLPIDRADVKNGTIYSLQQLAESHTTKEAVRLLLAQSRNQISNIYKAPVGKVDSITNQILNNCRQNIALDYRSKGDMFMYKMWSPTGVSLNKISFLPKRFYKNANKSKEIDSRTFGELFETWDDKCLMKVDKAELPIIYPSFCDCKPYKQNPATTHEHTDYNFHNGAIIFDIDFPKHSTYRSDIISIIISLNERLCAKPWYMASKLSASSGGIHIICKYRIPEENRTPQEITKIDSFNVIRAGALEQAFQQAYFFMGAQIAYILQYDCNVNMTPVKRKGKKSQNILDPATNKIFQQIATNYTKYKFFNTNTFREVEYTELIDNNAPVHITTDGKELSVNDIVYDAKLHQLFADVLTKNEKKKIKSSKGEKLEPKKLTNLPSIDGINLESIQPITDYIINQSPSPYSTRTTIANALYSLTGKDTDKTKAIMERMLPIGEAITQGEFNSFIDQAKNQTFESKYLKYVKFLFELANIPFELNGELIKLIQKEDKFDFEAIMKKQDFCLPEVDTKPIKLKKGQYLSNVEQNILFRLKGGCINLIESNAGTGKTTFFRNLAEGSDTVDKNPTVVQNSFMGDSLDLSFNPTNKKKYRILIAVPFNSVAENKFQEGDFLTVTEGTNLKAAVGTGKSIVTSFNKFAKIDKTEYRQFDMIVLDESHMIFTEDYRFDMLSSLLLKVKEIAAQPIGYNINHSNNMDVQKLILMTGTPIAEIDYFSYYKMLNYIKIESKHQYRKNVHFTFTKYANHKKVAIMNKIVKAIENKEKVFVPTNEGNEIMLQVKKFVTEKLGQDITTHYYKKENKNEENQKLIMNKCTTGDIQLLFSTSYFSVGSDLNDTDTFRVIVDGNEHGAEAIEQYANRLRRTDLNIEIINNLYVGDEDNEKGIREIRSIHTNNYGIDWTIKHEHFDRWENDEIKNRIKKHHGNMTQLESFYPDYHVNDEYSVEKFELMSFFKQYKHYSKGALYQKTKLMKHYGYTYGGCDILENIDQKELIRFAEIKQSVCKIERKKKSDLKREFFDWMLSQKATLRHIYGSIKANKEVKFIEGKDMEFSIECDDRNNKIIYYPHEYAIVIKEKVIKDTVKHILPYTDIETFHNILGECSTGDNEIINDTKLSKYVTQFKARTEKERGQLNEVAIKINEIIKSEIGDENVVIYDDLCDFEQLEFKVKSRLRDEIKDNSTAKTNYLKELDYDQFDKYNNIDNMVKDIMSIYIVSKRKFKKKDMEGIKIKQRIIPKISGVAGEIKARKNRKQTAFDIFRQLPSEINVLRNACVN